MPATQSPNPNPDLDLLFIGGQGIVMDYPCAKFGDFFRDFSFSLLVYCVDRHVQTDRSYTHRCG